ncbi:MAG: RNA methyltransferase [Candidatus Melainabacteria bacterium]|nr:RNA methyltransferase [Candidatus Melainabacteria bacterium]
MINKQKPHKEALLEITSRQNSIYKKLKKISKEKTNLIFIEGRKLLIEAINSPIKLTEVYLDKKNKDLYLNILNTKKHDLIFINNELLSSLYNTESKPTQDDLVIALAQRPTFELSNLFTDEKNLIFLENIQNPGNLGLVIREALAFGAGGVILSSNSVDPYSSKVVRSSAGALFNLPVVSLKDIDNLKKIVKEKKYKIIATSSKKGKAIQELDLNQPLLYLFGNEGRGLSQELLEIADEVVTIPHSGKVESLNLGVAVSIVLWVAFYQ